MAQVKRRLTAGEEFEIMKLVFDKFLWLGTIIMGYGLYVAISREVHEGLYYVLAGAVILVLFAIFLAREFERLR